MLVIGLAAVGTAGDAGCVAGGGRLSKSSGDGCFDGWAAKIFGNDVAGGVEEKNGGHAADAVLFGHRVVPAAAAFFVEVNLRPRDVVLGDVLLKVGLGVVDAHADHLQAIGLVPVVEWDDLRDFLLAESAPTGPEGDERNFGGAGLGVEGAAGEKRAGDLEGLADLDIGSGGRNLGGGRERESRRRGLGHRVRPGGGHGSGEGFSALAHGAPEGGEVAQLRVDAPAVEEYFRRAVDAQLLAKCHVLGDVGFDGDALAILFEAGGI